ncbi:MAG: spore coat protein [Streptosporangiales bacterium]|nr:spore coat protein [Streptosporangiales bacterium]
MVAFCCDAGPQIGVGHVMRCIALAEAVAARGLRPVFFASVADLPWAGAQLRRRGFQVVASADDPSAYLRAVLGRQPAAVVLDSYLLPAEVSEGFQAAGVPVLAIVDGELAGHRADLYVDQNLGAEDAPVDLPAGAVRLAGLRYAMLRAEIAQARPAQPGTGAEPGVPHVLAFFGGTDAFGAAPVLCRALALTGQPFTATVVAAAADRVAEVDAVPLAGGQRVTVIPPTDDLAAHVLGADLVLAASGTSLWELLCLGAAAAVVYVADNQLVGYRRTVATGAVAGLGSLRDVRSDPAAATARLAELLRSADERAALRRRGWALVDGRGTARVADALLDVLSAEHQHA